MTFRFILALLAMAGAADGARAEASVLPPPKTLAAAMKQADCNRKVEQVINDAHIEDLGGGYTLAKVLCWMGPYQASDLLVLTGPSTKGVPRVLVFHDWVDGKFEPTLAVMMADYDAPTKKLTSFSKGRGSGDCGTAGEWLWTGSEFKMSGFWSKPDCDGGEFERSERYQVFPPRKK